MITTYAWPTVWRQFLDRSTEMRDSELRGLNTETKNGVLTLLDIVNIDWTFIYRESPIWSLLCAAKTQEIKKNTTLSLTYILKKITRIFVFPFSLTEENFNICPHLDFSLYKLLLYIQISLIRLLVLCLFSFQNVIWCPITEHPSPSSPAPSENLLIRDCKATSPELGGGKWKGTEN